MGVVTVDSREFGRDNSYNGYIGESKNLVDAVEEFDGGDVGSPANSMDSLSLSPTGQE
jgi:hypothetical protein